MSYKKRRDYIAQQRAKAHASKPRVTRSRSEIAALAFEGIMFFLMGVLFSYFIRSFLWI